MKQWHKLKHAHWLVKAILFVFTSGVVAGPIGMIIWILIASIVTGTIYTLK